METLANSIALITKYSTEAWDKVYKKDSMASLLSDTNGLVQFSVDNAKVVKVAKVSYGGLNDYNRNNIQTGAAEGLASDRGYQEAAASLTWETRELTQDRGAKYVIENMDNEETAGLAVASATVEINRTQVIPEVDAYCFSKIASEVKSYNLGNYVSGSISASAPLAAFNAGLKWLDDHEVAENNRIAFVSTAFFNNLRSTPELYRRLDVEGPVDKKVSFRIVSYEGIDLVVVPPKRFGVEFSKRPHGGYYFPSTDIGIDFIVMDKGAAVHVVKYQKQKVLTGEAALANTDMDATVLFVRIYHDLFVFDNKVEGIYVHVGGYALVGAFADFAVIMNGEGVITSILTQPSGTLVRIYITDDGTDLPTVGADWTTPDSGYAPFEAGMAFTEATEVGAPHYLVGVVGGQVVAVKDFAITTDNGKLIAAISDHA
jgi:hypothetical protein